MPIAPLPRIKPAVAETADVVYHQTRELTKSNGGADDGKGSPPPQQMQRL